MVLTKLVSLCFLTSAAVIFVNVLTGRHQELANEVSSVLHQSFTRSTYEIHDPKVMEVRHEVILHPLPSSAMHHMSLLSESLCPSQHRLAATPTAKTAPLCHYSGHADLPDTE